MTVKEIPEKRKKYEWVAPDGGYGYVIWIAVIINWIAISSFVSCIGMIFKDMYIELDMNSTSITLLNGISSMCISIAGFVTGPLLNCISLRRLAVIAAIIFNLGAFGLAFINSRVLFFLLFGVLQSFGNGMLINISLTVLNNYFEKKRMLSVTVTQTVTAIGTLCSSYFVDLTAKAYGSRGTLILISAIYLQVFVAIALMQPVKWHLKKKEITKNKETDTKPLLKYDETLKEKTNKHTTQQPDTKHVVNTPEGKAEVIEDAQKLTEFQKVFKDFMDVPFLKSFLLSNASVGLAVSCFSDVTFVIMLPQALYFAGWSEDEVALVVSLSNFGDLVMKVIFIIFNSFLLKFGSHEIYIVGLFVAFFSRLGMLSSDNKTVMMIFITILGMSRCVVAMFFPLVISDAVPKEKFTTAVGIVMLLYGSCFLFIGPAIGAIRDLTNSYATAFYILTSFFGIVIMFWLIEMLYKKNKHKRIPKQNDSA